MSGAVSCLVNGVATDSVSVADRGLHCGDGVFETIVCLDGQPRWFDAHWARLLRGCERLGIAVPDRALALSEIRRLAAPSGRCVVKLIHTRGDAIARGYRPTGAELPTRMLLCYPWVGRQDEPFLACTARARLSANAQLAGIKHLNRLESVLAQQQLADTRCAEAIMLSSSGLVTCGSMSNIFMFEEGGLLTPELTDCGVAGVMRGCVLQACSALGIRVRVAALTPDALRAAPAAMVTNVRLGLQPLNAIDGRTLRPDPRSAPLQRWIDSHG